MFPITTLAFQLTNLQTKGLLTNNYRSVATNCRQKTCCCKRPLTATSAELNNCCRMLLAAEEGRKVIFLRVDEIKHIHLFVFCADIFFSFIFTSIQEKNWQHKHVDFLFCSAVLQVRQNSPTARTQLILAYTMLAKFQKSAHCLLCVQFLSEFG